ncbi:MAG TPA: diguanylate cyclase [Candidatus Limnocylindria bacterium]|nr:diguanylate cyclase [Candidatus Limnocylindria bacterium]
MTTLVPSLDERRRQASIANSGLRIRLRDVPAAIRASEYLVVGGGQRFRGVQRHRIRAASRLCLLVGAAFTLLDATYLIGLGAASVGPAIAFDMLVGLTALLAWWQLPRRLYHHPEATASAITLGLAIAAVATGTLAPVLAVQTVAYLVLFPTLVALALPWRTIVHLRWLAAFAFIVAAYLLIGAGMRFSVGERVDLIIVLVVSIVASLIGHGILNHGQIQAFAQMERIRVLRGRAASDHRELERVHDELERSAAIDPLTGAGNRRRLHEDLVRIRAHMDRSGTSYGLMEVDIDHFKGINDQLGHLAGDEVLVRVVEALSTATRATDAVYRYGGEEFVVLLPIQDADHLLRAAERLRTAVLRLRIEHPANGKLGVVSVSIGATLIGTNALHLSDEQWFEAVDRAMYEAKAGGRNQVRVTTALAA